MDTDTLFTQLSTSIGNILLPLTLTLTENSPIQVSAAACSASQQARESSQDREGRKLCYHSVGKIRQGHLPTRCRCTAGLPWISSSKTTIGQRSAKQGHKLGQPPVSILSPPSLSGSWGICPSIEQNTVTSLQ